MKKRILVLDDDQSILDIVTYILTETGYEVRTLLTGLRVAEAVQNFEPHLILMDVMLAEHDGRVICRLLKETIASCHIPVMLISGTHDLADSLNQPGAPDDFLAKPFDIDLLLSKIAVQLYQPSI